jgi:chemotaxis protein CheX
MEDDDIQIFVTGVLRYFESLESDTGVVIEPPFIKVKDHAKPFQEYSGIIQVSGRINGVVCFTATKTMLETILNFMNQDPTNPDAVSDLVGEIANTLSGNVREKFGREFMISVPMVAVGNYIESMFSTNTRNYVIPIIWRSEKAYLLVSLA